MRRHQLQQLLSNEGMLADGRSVGQPQRLQKAAAAAAAVAHGSDVYSTRQLLSNEGMLAHRRSIGQPQHLQQAAAAAVGLAD
jgi:hypothetical protein